MARLSMADLHQEIQANSHLNLRREQGGMKQSGFFSTVLLAAVVVVTVFLTAPHALFTQGRGAARKNAAFVKVGKQTKVVTLHAVQGDTIAWSDPAWDLYFQFSDAPPFEVETQTLKKGNTLALVVKSSKVGATPIPSSARRIHPL